MRSSKLPLLGLAKLFKKLVNAPVSDEIVTWAYIQAML